MSERKLVSLEFFAQHFNVDLSTLKWGVIIKSEYPFMSPGLIVDSKKFCIDIELGELCPIRKRHPQKLVIYPARLKEIGNQYTLTADTDIKETSSVSFRGTDIRDIYAKRCDVSTLK